MEPSPTTLRKMGRRLSGMRLENPVHIMEVCGTHTTEFFRSGIRDLFPPKLKLIDGPGCPVCVTTNRYLDRAIHIGRQKGVILTSFGDLMRVPASRSSLAREKSRGADIQVVYSPFDSLEIARHNPTREVVFLSVGFETTIPLEAVTLLEAEKEKIQNFSILAGNKFTPPAVHALLSSGNTKIDGFILPGHVTAVTGPGTWNFIAEKHRRPGIITGFTARHLLRSTFRLVQMIEKRDHRVINDYPEAVFPDGNPRARETVHRVFEPGDSHWRGIGKIPQSGLILRPAYRSFDAARKFPVSPPPSREHPECRCGEVLTGRIQPDQCPLFGKTCTPRQPVGACMVSTEGACAAYFKYGRYHHE